MDLDDERWQAPRHSWKMPGTSWMKSPRTPPFKPGSHRAQHFFHLAALLPPFEEGYTKALPLRWEPAFPEKAVLPEGMERRKEWEAALDAIRWLRGQLDATDRTAQRQMVVGVGGFCAADLFRKLPHGVDLMARCARNRALYELPHNEGYGRGRRRKYGEKAKKPHEWLSEHSGWRRAEFILRDRPVRPRYRVEGPFVLEKAAKRPVFLIRDKPEMRN
jgi:hypothetical protein